MNESDNKFRILSQLKVKTILNYKIVLKKYAQSLNLKGKPPIEIGKLRKSISDFFQSRRKFLLEHPDDPVDSLFAILNCFHSNYIVKR